MDNLIFSLNAMMPLFLLMVVGMVLRAAGVVNAATANGMNRFVFTVGIPVLLFHDLATTDLSQKWDPAFILFCFAATLTGIVVSYLASLAFRKTRYQGEFVQAAYRSSASMLAISVMQNIYGEPGAATLMVIGAVPLYNVMAVVILVLLQPVSDGEGSGASGKAGSSMSNSGRLTRATLVATLRDVVTNPIIIGVLAGVLWALVGLPMPPVLDKTLDSISNTVTPMGFVAMGVLFDVRKALAVRGPAVLATSLKLVLLAALTLPIAVLVGFRGQEPVAVLVMMGSATTLSSFVMARNMGHEGTLTSSVVMLSTLLSAFTLTGWLWVLRTLALI